MTETEGGVGWVLLGRTPCIYWWLRLIKCYFLPLCGRFSCAPTSIIVTFPSPNSLQRDQKANQCWVSNAKSAKGIIVAICRSNLSTWEVIVSFPQPVSASFSHAGDLHQNKRLLNWWVQNSKFFNYNQIFPHLLVTASLSWLYKLIFQRTHVLQMQLHICVSPEGTKQGSKEGPRRALPPLLSTRSLSLHCGAARLENQHLGGADVRRPRCYKDFDEHPTRLTPVGSAWTEACRWSIIEDNVTFGKLEL